MQVPDRERQVVDAFVRLSRTADGVDGVAGVVVELLARVTALLGVDAAGLMLLDGSVRLSPVGTWPPAAGLTSVLAAVARGPAARAVADGSADRLPDLVESAPLWPELAAVATTHGYRSLTCLPVRSGGAVLGVLAVLGARPGPLSPDDQALGQALTDVAATALAQIRAHDATGDVTRQLQGALTSRVVLEQAKGALSQQGSIGMDAAFAVLRRYARDHNLKLTQVAEAVLERRLPAAAVLAHDVTRGRVTKDPPR